jgi:CRISPR-associated protein Cas5h
MESVPPRCLAFEVRGEWAHFRRIDGTVVKQTYRVIPRTTVAGLCAAIVGAPRDSYYEAFQPDNSAIAVMPGDLRTVNVPMNSLTTTKSEVKTTGGRTGLQVRSVDSTKPRQQHNFEFVVDPVYRVFVWVDDTEFYTTLRTHLQNGTSVYTPSLGLSELLAEVEFIGEFDVELEEGKSTVDSAVPLTSSTVIPAPGLQQRTERSPGYMTADSTDGRPRRTTTGFIDWAYTETATDELTASGPIARVGDHAVVFV